LFPLAEIWGNRPVKSVYPTCFGINGKSKAQHSFVTSFGILGVGKKSLNSSEGVAVGFVDCRFFCS
jgi:hypothetical protein